MEHWLCEGGRRCGRDECGGFEDLGGVLAAHAVDDRLRIAAGTPTAEGAGDVVEVLRAQFRGVGREAEGRAGIRNQAADDGILGPSIGVKVHGRATGGLSEEGDSLGVSTKALDVIAHPFDC